MVVCPNCKLCFVRLESHLRHNPSCRIGKATLAQPPSHPESPEVDQQDVVSPPIGLSDNGGSSQDGESTVPGTLMAHCPEQFSCPPSLHFTNTDDLLEEFIADCIIPRFILPNLASMRSSRSSALQEASMLVLGAIETPTTVLPHVQPPAPVAEEVFANDGLQGAQPYVLPQDFDQGNHCFSSGDCAMMRIYKT
jgi:hypothetical protein